jgi:hypothetical protein
VYVGASLRSTRTFNSTATTALVDGLTNDVTYSFKVAARNSYGLSTLSTSTNKVTPAFRTEVWSTGMESGGLGSWTTGGGGSLENSGDAEAVATTALARSGSWSMRATIDTTGGSTGVRAFRWEEPRRNRSAYYSVWLYVPADYQLSGSDKWWNVFQFKSRTSDGSRNDPVWAFYVREDAGGLYVKAGWGWGGTTIAGPRSSDGVSGKDFAPKTKVYLPIGQWVHLEAFLHQSRNFDGILRFWQDDALLYDFQNVRTSYNNCDYNSWCADNEWSVNLYSDGLSPNPATAYFDDAAISR